MLFWDTVYMALVQTADTASFAVLHTTCRNLVLHL